MNTIHHQSALSRISLHPFEINERFACMNAAVKTLLLNSPAKMPRRNPRNLMSSCAAKDLPFGATQLHVDPSISRFFVTKLLRMTGTGQTELGAKQPKGSSEWLPASKPLSEMEALRLFRRYQSAASPLRQLADPHIFSW